MARSSLKPLALGLRALDRLTAPPRRRHAETLFFGGVPSRLDAWLSRLFFEVSAGEWARRGTTAAHLRPFTAGLEHCRDPRVVLDLGTGSGESARLVAERHPSAQVTAVDGSSRMIRIARDRHAGPNLEFTRGDFGKLPLAPGSIDLVCMLNALPVLEELARVTAEGAEVLVANTYFNVPETEWLRRWDTAGFLRLATEAVGDGSWQLFRRRQYTGTPP